MRRARGVLAKGMEPCAKAFRIGRWLTLDAFGAAACSRTPRCPRRVWLASSVAQIQSLLAVQSKCVRLRGDTTLRDSDLDAAALPGRSSSQSHPSAVGERQLLRDCLPVCSPDSLMQGIAEPCSQENDDGMLRGLASSALLTQRRSAAPPSKRLARTTAPQPQAEASAEAAVDFPGLQARLLPAERAAASPVPSPTAECAEGPLVRLRVPACFLVSRVLRKVAAGAGLSSFEVVHEAPALPAIVRFLSCFLERLFTRRSAGRSSAFCNPARLCCCA